MKHPSTDWLMPPKTKLSRICLLIKSSKYLNKTAREMALDNSSFTSPVVFKSSTIISLSLIRSSVCVPSNRDFNCFGVMFSESVSKYSLIIEVESESLLDSIDRIGKISTAPFRTLSNGSMLLLLIISTMSTSNFSSVPCAKSELLEPIEFPARSGPPNKFKFTPLLKFSKINFSILSSSSQKDFN